MTNAPRHQTAVMINFFEIGQFLYILQMGSETGWDGIMGRHTKGSLGSSDGGGIRATPSDENLTTAGFSSGRASSKCCGVNVFSEDSVLFVRAIAQ